MQAFASPRAGVPALPHHECSSNFSSSSSRGRRRINCRQPFPPTATGSDQLYGVHANLLKEVGGAPACCWCRPPACVRASRACAQETVHPHPRSTISARRIRRKRAQIEERKQKQAALLVKLDQLSREAGRQQTAPAPAPAAAPPPQVRFLCILRV